MKLIPILVACAIPGAIYWAISVYPPRPHSMTVVPGYVNAPTLTIRSLPVGSTLKTCAFVIAADLQVYVYEELRSAGECIGIRRDPDGLVAIFPKDRAGIWTVNVEPILWASPVVRVEYVATISDVHATETRAGAQ